MDTSELRIGNKILIINTAHIHRPDASEIVEVESICSRGINISVEYGSVSPDYDEESIAGIPLTSELLQNYEFTKYRYWWNTPKQNAFNFEEWKNDGLGLYLHINNHKVGQHIKYLHQLQNLYFSLTGQELEITLI